MTEYRKEENDKTRNKRMELTKEIIHTLSVSRIPVPVLEDINSTIQEYQEKVNPAYLGGMYE